MSYRWDMNFVHCGEKRREFCNRMNYLGCAKLLLVLLKKRAKFNYRSFLRLIHNELFFAELEAVFKNLTKVQATIKTNYIFMTAKKYTRAKKRNGNEKNAADFGE